MNLLSKETIDKCNSIDDVLDLATQGKDGKLLHFSDIGYRENGYKDFKGRLGIFKEVIERELPEFTIEEILKYNQYYHKLRALYEWNGYYYLFCALEFELKKSRK